MAEATMHPQAQALSRARRAAAAAWRAAYAVQLAPLAALGVATRLLYAAHVRAAATVGDAAWYHAMANQLAAHFTYDKPFTLVHGQLATAPPGTPPTAWHPPLFPLLLALASKLGASSTTAHQTVGCLLGGATVVLVGLLGRRLGGRRAGLLAAALTAIYLPLIAWDALLLSESLFVPLLVATLLATDAALQRPSRRRLLAVGALAALATLTRAEGVLLIALVLALLAWRLPAARWRGARWRGAGVAALAAVVLLAPWVVRNLVTFKGLVLASTGYAPLVLGANCPETYNGPQLGTWDIYCVARVPGTSSLTIAAPGIPDEGSASGHWMSQGLRYARDHLGTVPKVLTVRVLRTLELYKPAEEEGQDVIPHGHWRALERTATISYYVVAALALAGAVLLRRRRHGLALLALPILFSVLVSVLSSGETRFRVAADSALVVLAGIALAAASTRLTRWRAPAAP